MATCGTRRPAGRRSKHKTISSTSHPSKGSRSGALPGYDWRCASSSPYSVQGHDHQLALCHVFDGIAKAFAPQARIFHPAIRHMIDAEAGHVADDNRTYLKLFESRLDKSSIAGKDAGLQAVG